jgi:hypothetical protein
VLEAGVAVATSEPIPLFVCFRGTSDLLPGSGTLQYSVFSAQQLVLVLLLCSEPFAVAALDKYGIVVLCCSSSCFLQAVVFGALCACIGGLVYRGAEAVGLFVRVSR